jgi:hypothetical protein
MVTSKGNELEWKRSWPTRGTILEFIWADGRKPTVNLSPDIRSPGRDLNRAPPEHKSTVLLLDQPVPCLFVMRVDDCEATSSCRDGIGGPHPVVLLSREVVPRQTDRRTDGQTEMMSSKA